MSSALVNRSIATLKTELEFLRESNVISEDFFNKVYKSLPDRYQSGTPPVDLISSSSSSAHLHEKQNYLAPSKPPIQQRPSSSSSSSIHDEYVEVIYDYKAQQPEDLDLSAGDKVRVTEHTSPDWWKGFINGKEGMFPSNYVKPLASRSQTPLPHYQQSHVTSYQQPQPQPYQYGPPQQQQYAPSPQQQSPFPGYNYNNGSMVPYEQPQPQQQQSQQVIAQAEQQDNRHSVMGRAAKRFGSRLGNAAIFGAGATLGSDLVNSIL